MVHLGFSVSKCCFLLFQHLHEIQEALKKLVHEVLNSEANSDMAVCNLGRRYLVEISGADSRHAAFKYANGSVCFETQQQQLPSAGGAGLYLTLSIPTTSKCGSPVWLNMQNHSSRRRYSPGFLLFSLFFSPVLFGRRLPLAVSYCMLSRIITNLNMAHAATRREHPTPSEPQTGHVCFASLPARKLGPLWCTPIRETEK